MRLIAASNEREAVSKQHVKTDVFPFSNPRERRRQSRGGSASGSMALQIRRRLRRRGRPAAAHHNLLAHRVERSILHTRNLPGAVGPTSQSEKH